ncbi:MAG: hypothetical protein ACFCBV_14390 [Phycisphaerales bacterium]
MQDERPTSRMLRRHAIRGMVGSAAVMLGAWGGFFASMVAGLPLVIVAPISVLLIAGGMVIPAWMWFRDRRHIRTCGGQACMHCLYDLRSSSSAGRCPECGIEYRKADIVREWRNLDSSYQAKKLYTFEEDHDRQQPKL